MFHEIGARDGEAWALNGLGEAARLAGQPARALPTTPTPCAIVSDIGVRDQQARAHAGLGHAQHALQEPAPARRHFQLASLIYTELGMPDAGELHDVLTARDESRRDRP